METHDAYLLVNRENNCHVMRVERVIPVFSGKQTLKERKMKYTVKIGISSLSSSALLEKGRTVGEMLLGNAGYPTLQAQLPALATLCDDLERANNDVLFNSGKITQEAKRLAEVALRDALKVYAGYVQGISAGSKAMILSAGFDVVKQGTALPSPAAPADLVVRRTDVQGILKVKWSRVAGTKLSYLEMVEDGTEEWSRVLSTTRTSHVMTNLTTGKKYSFRVQVITSSGISPMSEVVTNIAA